MIERVITPENITLGVEALGLLGLAFSRLLKQKIKEEQNFRCDKCGKKTFLQVHHRVPQCLNGNDKKPNGVALCPNCHVEADNEAMLEGIIYPGIPIEHAPANLFKNKNIRQKTVYKYVARRRR